MEVRMTQSDIEIKKLFRYLGIQKDHSICGSICQIRKTLNVKEWIQIRKLFGQPTIH